MMKNAFDFTLKLYLLLRYLEFCPDFSRHIGKRLDKKIYDIATGKQIIIIHILPDISGNKVDQTRKLGQFIKYNIRNIFIEIS